MPKVLLINTFANCYSTGRLAAEVGEVAESKGWETYLAYAEDAKLPCKSKLIRIMHGRLGAYFHIFFWGRLMNMRGFGSWLDTIRLIHKIKKIKPDIVHMHNVHQYFLDVPMLCRYLAKAGIPVVWSLHDCWTITGGCTHFAYNKCDGWKTGCGNCPQHKNDSNMRGPFDFSRVVFRHKKINFNKPDKMIVVSASNWLAKLAKQNMFSKYDVRQIPNGIDLQTFSPKSSGQQVRDKLGVGDKFILLGVATSWSKLKGLEDYYKLRERLPQNCVIVLVGLSAEQISILPAGIIGVCKTKNIEELVELYSAADVVVSLSYQEAFGLTPIEGYACGTPAIVYNCTSTPELVVPEVGEIVEPGDIEGIVVAVGKIRAQGKNGYITACRERAVKLYNKFDRYAEYVDIYNELINNKNLC